MSEQRQLRQLLNLAYADYKNMDTTEQIFALKSAMQLLQNILQDSRTSRTSRQKLTELEAGASKEKPHQSHITKRAFS